MSEVYMKINGKDMSEYFRLTSLRGRSLPGRNVNLIEVTGMDGAYLNTHRLTPREIEAELLTDEEDSESVILLLSALSDEFSGEDLHTFEFTDEPNVEYYGIVSDVSEGDIINGKQRIGFTILCPDPYKYGPELEAVLPGDYVTVTNRGSAPTKPTFILQPSSPVTFALIQNQNNEYMMIGKPAEVEESAVDERTTYFTERGETLDAWNTPPIRQSSGHFTTTGDAIVVGSYGTGDAWHGPAVMREVDATQDFEVEMYIYVRTDQPNRTFMTTFNLYDEGLNEIGMMRLWDKTTNQVRKVAEARVGSYIENYVNYLIDDRNYNIQGQRVWGGILRLTRVGNELTFYVARVTQGGRHTHAFRQTFTDNIGEYMGRLKYVQFEIKKFGDTQAANEVRVESIKVTKLTKATVDQTPYIAYPGDEIIFDHASEEILINGEDATYLKQFGADYFPLNRGANELIVQPNDSFGVGMKYREKFK